MRNIRQPGLGLALLCSLALMAGGCFGGSTDTNGAKCSSNKDCNNGQSCVSGVCKANSGGGTGGGTACKSNSDCSATQTCSNGTCVDKCKNVICNSGQVCNDADGSCVQCMSSSDCPSGQTCNTSTHTCSGGSGGGGGGAQGPACTAGGSTCTQSQVCQNGHCQPTDYGDCSKLSCATGLDCKTFQTQSGSASLCLQPCKATSDCGQPDFVCDTGSSDPASGYCLQNLCGPSLSSGVQGLINEQKVAFGSACNAAGSNDGTCWGPIGTLQGTPAGLCFGNGTVAPGGSCDPTASYSKSSSMCNAGLCNPTSQTNPNKGVCLAFCAIADGKTCSAIGTQATACLPIAELGGICIPQDANPAATGASCTPLGNSHQSLSCVSDDACLSSGSSNTCVQLCDQTAATSTCPQGTTCQKDAKGDALLGNCK